MGGWVWGEERGWGAGAEGSGKAGGGSGDILVMSESFQHRVSPWCSAVQDRCRKCLHHTRHTSYVQQGKKSFV